MKKFIASVLIIAVVMVLFPYGEAFAESGSNIYVLPSSLVVIEESAFDGTAARAVVLPTGFLKIEGNAFANVDSLTDVFIPRTTNYIANTAFPEMIDFVIHGEKGSYALEWAQEHSVRFDTEVDRTVPPINRLLWGLQTVMSSLFGCIITPEMIRKIIPKAEDEDKSWRPQDRPELNPIDYRFP